MPSKKPKGTKESVPRPSLTRPPLNRHSKKMKDLGQNPESGEQSEGYVDIERSDSSLEDEAGSFFTGRGGSSVGNARAKETQLPPSNDRRIGDHKSSKHSHASTGRWREQNPIVESDFVEHAAQGSPVCPEVGNVKATAPPLVSSGDSMDEDEDMLAYQQVQMRESDFAGYAAEGFPKNAGVGNSKAVAPQWPGEDPMIKNRELPVHPPDAPRTRRRPSPPPRASSQNKYDQSQPQNSEMYPAIHDGTGSRRVGDKPQEAPYPSTFIPEAACRPRGDQPPAVKRRPKTSVDTKTDYGQNQRQVPQRCPPTIKAASGHGPRPPRRTQQIPRHSRWIEIAIALTSLVHSKNLKYLAVLLILSGAWQFKGCFFSTGAKEESGLNVTDVMMDLRSEFPNLPRMSFRVIHSAIRNVALPEPKAPAIIVLLAAKGSETACDRLAHKLVNSLSSSDHIAQISGKDYEEENVNSAKKDIDDMISKTLRTDRMGAVLVDGLDHIPGDAALIFHTYCDHENAPFKRAVYVMTVSYGKTILSDSDSKSWDKALQDHLYSAWADVGVDQVSPLLSRLTVSVAAITAQTA